jgi:HD-GYP domain-containing protein (c-di-GMP phosphodiesterase class II)
MNGRVVAAEAQTLRYAEELRELVRRERRAREQAEATTAELQASYATAVRALAAALDLRDDASGAHAARVTTLGLLLAQKVASPDTLELQQLEFGFLLHDVGKIGVPDSILLKLGPLDVNETAIMRRHAELGEQIVDKIPYLSAVVRGIVRSHHERWDGHGYPDRLTGDAIPFAARMFAIVDAYDAMTNDRPYRLALPRQVAEEQLQVEAGRQFDPQLVPEFLRLDRDLR